ncbi:hypothetical protein [Streptomyces sp. NRRL F-5126]|uniref:hypothetical protein n=1 Tax=Streptomyces sp. NRRL F-5126 TaxID=1463857 RepID=UPI0004C8676C|nr:hypothetical protein [Streptomyces sp. NRRL F-5126]
MAGPELGKRATGLLAAGALLAAAPLMAACGGDSDSASGAASPSASASVSSSPSDSSGSGSDSGAGGESGTPADGQSTASGVVASWVSAVIAKDAKQVCRLSVAPGSKSDPKPATAQTCTEATLKQLEVGLPSMSEAFSPKGSSGTPQVQVDAPEPKGDSVTVPSVKIKVDGQRLRAILVSRSKGVETKSFRAKAKADRIDGKWYIGDFDMGSSGSQTIQPKPQKTQGR